MGIDLDKLEINAPLMPTRTWREKRRNMERYDVTALVNRKEVGNLRIVRALNITGDLDEDNFYFDFSSGIMTPRPFISWQKTREDFRGQGISGLVIVKADEFYSLRFGHLYSDTKFLEPFKTASKRVWQKLEEQGLARYEPHVLESGERLDRWFMVGQNT